MTPEQACKSDAAKLAALRLNPSPDQVAKISSALMCEDLRPQVERFVESLGMEIPGDQKSRSLEVGDQKSRTLEAPPRKILGSGADFQARNPRSCRGSRQSEFARMQFASPAI